MLHPARQPGADLFWQAVLGLRWFRDRTSPDALARDHDISRATRNALQRSLRCLGERRFAQLNQLWRTLQHITASPSKIGAIARAALVLSHFEHG
ncbi:MAG TPA: hypothetical protein VGS19_17380 [Streptosporangiaceae bacterium]|nr:hypothetical protein [Streptosporangiaceae bacterium]